MSIEETKEAIRVMQAFVDGKEVEYQISDGTWLVGLSPNWNWPSTRYRIKHTLVSCDGGIQMSDTPRTDEELVEMTTGYGPVVTKTTWVHSSLCFQLERELNVANERISKLNNYVAALETAGDLMANELSYGYDVDMWNKAKEDKP